MAKLLAANPHGRLVMSQLTNLKHSRSAQQIACPSHRSSVRFASLSRSGSRGRRRAQQWCAASGAAQDDKPQWLRDLEQDAKEDPDIARLLEGTNSDPERVRQRMQDYMAKGGSGLISERLGVEEQMQVTLREVDPFSCWLWMELYFPPSEEDVAMIEEVLKSWFLIGRLGGYNGMNLQVFNAATEEGASFLQYDAEECESALSAFFHDMSNTESKGNWLRTWVNMGTSDEIAIDILINVLSTFSKENLGIKQLTIGGENEDWKVPEMQLPKATMDPMQATNPFEGIGEDDQDDFE